MSKIRFFFLTVIFLMFYQYSFAADVSVKQSQTTHKPVTVSTDSLSTLDMEALKYSYLEKPIFPANDVKRWGEKVAMLAFNYDYDNYVEKFSTLSLYFTYNGWKRFLTFLWLSHDSSLENVVASHLTVTGTKVNPSIIWARYPEEGRFTWEVLVPLMVHYTGPGVNLERKINFIITISRVSTKVQKNGIAVIAVREVSDGVYPGLME